MGRKVTDWPEKRPRNQFHGYRHARQQSTGGRNPSRGPSAARLHLLNTDFIDAGHFSAERRRFLGFGRYAGIDAG